MSTVPVAGLRLQFCADPGEFLAAAGDYLAADPVVSTVVTTVAHRLLAQQADGTAPPGRTWWLVVRNASAVAGAAMRTAPFAPHPPFLLPMPDEAAVALARTLHERGEEVLGLNGARPAVDLCAAELARIGAELQPQPGSRDSAHLPTLATGAPHRRQISVPPWSCKRRAPAGSGPRRLPGAGCQRSAASPVGLAGQWWWLG